MKFYLDKNFPKAACALLKNLGHEWIDQRGTQLEGCSDNRLAEEATAQGAVILTTDRDFYHTLQHEFPDHPGIIVIALKQPSRAAIIERLEWALSHFRQEDLAGRAFQLRDRTWVSQPPLPEAGDQPV